MLPGAASCNRSQRWSRKIASLLRGLTDFEPEGRGFESLPARQSLVEHGDFGVPAGAVIVSEPETHDYGPEYQADCGYECRDSGGHHGWFYQRLRTGAEG